MSKVLMSRDWLSLDDTAAYLSKSFNEQVRVADLFYWASERRLKISMLFITAEPVRHGELDSWTGVRTRQLDQGTSFFRLNGADDLYFLPEENIEFVTGVLDLTMMGDEVEHLKTLQHPDEKKWWGEIFLFEPGNSKVCMLQTLKESSALPELPENEAHKQSDLFGPQRHIDSYVLVVRPRYLFDFEKTFKQTSLEEESDDPKGSHLRLISALLDLLQWQRSPKHAHSFYENDDDIKDALELQFGEKERGFSTRTSDALFAQARRARPRAKLVD